MDFHILGPLEVLDEGRPIPLGGGKQRALLALLLLHADETLGIERIADELWGEAPATAAKTVQVYVSRLRKALAGGDGPPPVVTHAHGYALVADPERVDAHRFERLLAEGRRALMAGQPQRAAASLEEGLALWRGPPLADLAFERFAQPEVGRLEDLRVDALEQLVEARLALGRHADVIGQLEALVAEHPYRERLRAQLMLALYRSDRQAEALQAYQDARRCLVDELGIEPGERLRELERAVLAQDPVLAAPEPAPDKPAPPPPQPGPDVPTGVLTFVLTDVEGSTALWEADPEAMAAALELHDELVARAAEEHGGRLLKAKGEGDSTFSVFRRASDAAACAARIQRALAGAGWGGAVELRVRIAVHTGEAQERSGDYFGPAVNRAARLRGLATGGATLLSQATAEIVRDRLPAGTELVDRGRRELRGMTRAENVFELRTTEPTAPADAEAELRKTVTVVLAEIEAGTERPDLDPEARGRVARAGLDVMRAILERHGASVAACPGDALMAVFGVPRLHEDDARRAAAAVAELPGALASLGAGEGSGGAVAARIGVGTGEVIAAGSGLPTGAAVNNAKRLQGIAASGEVLIDAATHRLVRGDVDAEPATLRDARTGAEVTAWRLDRLRPVAAPRGGAERSPLVGRERQLHTLSMVFEAAVADRACHLATVLGVAGVGKSRLVEEFAERLGDEALILRGRCLPYGEGITYWPLAELIRDLTGTADDPAGATSAVAVAAALEGEPKAEAIASGVADALGLAGSTGATTEAIFWAIRGLFEALARDRPLVVVVDDLQWAEATFLDLLEHVADLSRGAPIVVLCLARPELLDVRPGWGGGKLNATSILVEALDAEAGRRLAGNLLRAAGLESGEVASRLAEASEGNPLYVEELLATLREDGLLEPGEDGTPVVLQRGELPVPPTIHALIAARLERLPDDERALLARVSVEGTVFHRAAMRELAPPALTVAVDRALTALVRRDLIRPERSSFAGGDAFRFRHMLIRDVAYGSLPKRTRAALHERFATWLEGVAGERMPEYDEIAGYHLEQAHAHLAEVASASEHDAALAARAAGRLWSAGRRAIARGDRVAGAGLLERAAKLLARDDGLCARVLHELGAALIEIGRLADADAALDGADRAAAAAGDEAAAAHALVQRQFLRLHLGAPDAGEQAADVVRRALPVFERAVDERGLCAALRLSASRHWIAARAGDAAAAWEAAAVHARLAGAEHERDEILAWMASSHFFGPTPAADGIRRCEAIREEVDGNLGAVAGVLEALAGLLAMEGRFDEARRLLGSSHAAYAELGLTLNTAVSHHTAIVELLAGDAAAAEASLRRGYATLEEMGDRALLATTAAFLGQTLLAQGRHEEAEGEAATSAELAAEDDLITQALWRGVRARSLAVRGAVAEAEVLARHAVELAERTDFVNHQAEANADLADVLDRAGRDDDAREAAAAALCLFERKGNVVAAGRLRAALAASPPV